MGEWRQQEGERLLPTRVSLEQPLFQLPSPGSLLVFPLRQPAWLLLRLSSGLQTYQPGSPSPEVWAPSGATRLLGAQSLVLVPLDLQF